MEERREHERRAIRFKVVLSPPEGPHRYIMADAMDLSMGGMRIRLKEAIKSGGKIALRIARPFFQDMIDGTGEIIWQKGPDDSNDIFAGVRFIEMPFTKIKALIA